MAETPKRSSRQAKGRGRVATPDYIHDVASAAIRARVSPDPIRGWIQGGMRAMPIGRRRERVPPATTGSRMHGS